MSGLSAREGRNRIPSFSILLIQILTLNFIAAFGQTLSFASTISYEDVKWKEIGAKRQRRPGDDLKVYITSVGENPVMAFKVDGTLNGSLPEVANLVLDLEQQKSWVPELTEAQVVGCVGPNERLEYYHIATPPFVQDRDFLLKTKIQVDRKKKVLIIESHSVQDARKGPIEDRVRGKVHMSKYTLTALDNGKTRLQYYVHVDPMGDIAKWLVNFAQKAYPKRTVKSLKRRLRRGSAVPNPQLSSIFRIPSNKKEKSLADNVICGETRKQASAE